MSTNKRVVFQKVNGEGIPVVGSIVEQNLQPYNTEEWITESGTWTAPVTGWYDVWLINGGDGGLISPDYGFYGGRSGSIYNSLMYFTAGSSVDVVIGVGGIGELVAQYLPSNAGGITSFGGINPMANKALMESFGINVFNAARFCTSYCSIGHYLGSAGGGFGGGTPSSEQGLLHGQFFGAGGGACQNTSSSDRLVGNGIQGAVRLRYYDPNKSKE